MPRPGRNVLEIPPSLAQTKVSEAFRPVLQEVSFSAQAKVAEAVADVSHQDDVEKAPVSPPASSGAVPRAFTRELQPVQLERLELILAPAFREQLLRLARDHFEQAVTSDGGGKTATVGCSGMNRVTRQLNRLSGLPDMDQNTVRWFYDAHAADHGLDLEGFCLAYLHLLRTSLAVHRPQRWSAESAARSREHWA